MESGGLEEIALKYYGIFNHNKIINNIMNGNVIKYHMFLDKNYYRWLYPVNNTNETSYMPYSVYKFNCVRYVDIMLSKKIPTYVMQTHMNNMSTSLVDDYYNRSKNFLSKNQRFITNFVNCELIGQGLQENNTTDALMAYYSNFFKYIDIYNTVYLQINKSLCKKFFKATNDLERLISFISEDVIDIMKLLWNDIMCGKGPSHVDIKQIALLQCGGPLYTAEFVRDINTDVIKNQIRDIIVRNL